MVTQDVSHQVPSSQEMLTDGECNGQVPEHCDMLVQAPSNREGRRIVVGFSSILVAHQVPHRTKDEVPLQESHLLPTLPDEEAVTNPCVTEKAAQVMQAPSNKEGHLVTVVLSQGDYSQSDSSQQVLLDGEHSGQFDHICLYCLLYAMKSGLR